MRQIPNDVAGCSVASLNLAQFDFHRDRRCPRKAHHSHVFVDPSMHPGVSSMRTVQVYPLKVNDPLCSNIQQDLLRAFASVLMWATRDGCVAMTFAPTTEPALLFTKVSGSTTTEAKHVANPPDHLKQPLASAVLRGVSGNLIYYAWNRIATQFFASHCEADFDVVTDDGTTRWRVRYCRETIECVWREGVLAADLDDE